MFRPRSDRVVSSVTRSRTNPSTRLARCWRSWSWVACAAVCVLCGGTRPASRAAEAPAKPPATSERKPAEKPAEVIVKQLVSGRVVLLSKVLKERDIEHYGDEIRGQVVLETREGELLPIVPDWRGRAFFQDERLRDRPVDLLVQRRPKSPYLQVLSIYTFDDAGARQLTDYWCDICSIPMYEIKDCECCQGPIRLRFQKKDPPKVVE